MKKYFTSFIILNSYFFNAQVSSTPSSYSQMYENQGIYTQNALKNNTNLTAKEQLDQQVEQLANDPALRNANWGFVLYNPANDKIVSSYNPNGQLIPASTTKLLTTDTAYSSLGGDFQWLTQLEYSGSINADGILNGNLYLIGSGDPSLGTGKAGSLRYSQLVSDFSNAIREKGIKKVNGNIYLQTAYFKQNKINSLPHNIVWMDQQSYLLPVGSVADVAPTDERSLAQANNPFNNNKKYVFISNYQKKLAYSDKFQSQYFTGKLPTTPHLLAKLLKTNLAKNHIPVLGKIEEKLLDPSPEPRNTLYTYQSPSLRDIVKYTNHKSDNALAESILKIVGYQKLGNFNQQSGIEAVLTNLKNKDLDISSLSFVDGSGLSRGHSVSPIFQTKFLTQEMKQPYFSDYFESLPTGGESGTLKNMFTGDAYGQVFAKTGTLNRVKTLAGYLKTRSGKTLVFSLLLNNFSGSTNAIKTKMEQLLIKTLDL